MWRRSLILYGIAVPLLAMFLGSRACKQARAAFDADPEMIGLRNAAGGDLLLYARLASANTDLAYQKLLRFLPLYISGVAALILSVGFDLLDGLPYGYSVAAGFAIPVNFILAFLMCFGYVFRHG